jgi:hypothetical protein
MYLDTITPEFLAKMQELVNTDRIKLTKELDYWIMLMRGSDPSVWLLFKLFQILRGLFGGQEKSHKRYPVVGYSKESTRYFRQLQPILAQKLGLCEWHRVNASLTDAQKAAHIATMLHGVTLKDREPAEQNLTAALIVQIGIDHFCGCSDESLS